MRFLDELSNKLSDALVKLSPSHNDVILVFRYSTKRFV